MEEMNPLIQLLEGLVENRDRIHIEYRNKMYALSDPDLPVAGAVSFMRRQLKLLKAMEKEQQD